MTGGRVHLEHPDGCRVYVELPAPTGLVGEVLQALAPLGFTVPDPTGATPLFAADAPGGHDHAQEGHG